MKAKDIMHKKVVTVPAYLTTTELAKLFMDHCISGAPVLDEAGTLIGVVSQTDLVRYRREQPSEVPVYHLNEEEKLPSRGMHLESMETTRVDQIMTPGAICFDEETPVTLLAEKMTDLHIHRVLITREGRLTGIISSMDMLRALLAKKAPKTKTKSLK